LAFLEVLGQWVPVHLLGDDLMEIMVAGENQNFKEANDILLNKDVTKLICYHHKRVGAMRFQAQSKSLTITPSPSTKT